MRNSARCRDAVRLCLTCSLVGMFFVSFGGGDLVVNGGFDERADGKVVGWGERLPMYRFVPGGGRSMTTGLYYENDDATKYVFTAQEVKAEPFKQYVFGAWVRTENIVGSGGGATVGLEWYDKDGNYVGGDYPNGVKGTSDGWVKLEFRLTPVPPHATKVVIFPYVRHGCKGKAWFDDVFLRPYEGKPVEALYSDAYRNRAAKGVVTFKAAIRLTDETPEPKSLFAEFSFADKDGKVRRLPATRMDSLVAEASVPVTDFAAGETMVNFRLVAECGKGKELGHASLVFHRDDRADERRVRIDTHGRAIVDGKPFFPLGMYFGQALTNLVDIYAKGPFNCLMPYTPPTRAQQDHMYAKGLKFFYSLKDAYYGTRWCPGGIRTTEDEYAFMRREVAAAKGHPGLLAWYLNDEAPLTMLPRLVGHRDLMEQIDPDHPCWSVLMQYDVVREYMPSFDVVGTDPYPLPDQPVSMATYWTRATARGTMGAKTFWQVPQVYDARADKPWTREKYKAPSLAEIRSLAWQCLAAGAKGLVFYSFFELYEERLPENKFAPAWRDVCTMAEDIRARIPVFLSVEPAPGAACAAKDVSVRAWRHEGAVYLLAVNMTREAQSALVEVAGNYGEAVTELGPKAVLKGANRVEAALGPMEYVFVRLK